MMNGEANENYRKIALLLANTARGSAPLAVVFTGVERGGGTTTAVLNVARHLKASCGLRPLVVELAAERPVLASMFKLDAARSLRAFARAERPLRECAQDSALDVPMVPAGGSAAAREDLTDVSAALRRLLDEAQADFDLVLVDAPPLLKSADALAAAAVVRQFILVVEAGRTRQEMLDRARVELERAGAKLLGAVLNKHQRYIPGWIYRALVQ